MNILHIGKYYAPFNGGIEQVTQSLAENCAEAGDNVRVLAHEHERDANKLATCAKAQATGVTVKKVPIWGILMFTPIAPLFAWYLWRELKQNPDIIHIHMPNPSAFWLLLLPSARKAKWLVHWHSDVIDDQASAALRLFYRAYRPFERWLLRRADVVVCTSPNYARHSGALRDVQNKVRVVPLGVNVGRAFGATTSEPNPTPQPLKLLTVGRLTYYKGHRYLLESIAHLKKRNVDVIWNIVGTGEEEANLRQRCRALDLNQNVNFLGRLSDEALQQQFNQCDVFCLPSIERTEAFGIVLMEAMRAEKPCVVTDVPGSGMSYVVSDGVTGRVAKRCDSYSLASLLEDASLQRERWRQMGINGRLRLEQYFRSDVVAAQMREVYRGML